MNNNHRKHTLAFIEGVSSYVFENAQCFHSPRKLVVTCTLRGGAERDERELLRMALGYWPVRNAVQAGEEIVNLVYHCISGETSSKYS